MAWKSSSKKNRPSSSDLAALRQLQRVREQRLPFEGLSRKIVGATLDRFLPADGKIVEIGMGDGQLRKRLPETLLPRVVHTEPMAAPCREFRRHSPDVPVLQAPAEKLPFADAEVAAVLGLCVLDVVDDGAEVARELARVLAPGGRFIHWLDMSTMLNGIIEAVVPGRLIPLPNVFSDPSASQWPEDLFLAPRRELELVASVLARHQHPLATPMQQYLSVYARSPFELGPAVAEFIQLQESGEIRAALQSMFRAAFELAGPELRQELADFKGRPVSSALHFEQRLKHWFTPQAGFEVELSGIMTAWELAPRSEHDSDYISSCVGEQRHLRSIPDVLLCSDARVGSAAETLLELGVFVFVASRI
jgi:ubiquinone/menaquinone biosynthesis C-methylase UbiE